jgi:hypothetical protein
VEARGKGAVSLPHYRYRRTRLCEGEPVAVAHAIGPIDVIGPIDDRAGVSAKDSARGPC